MKKAAEVMEVWEAIRGELRVLRGRNRFRGNEEHLLHRGEVWLHFENRGDSLRSAVIVVHLTSRLEDLRAVRVPGDGETRVADFGGDWKAWLRALVDECRGADYMHTHSSSAEYRKIPEGTTLTSDQENGTAR